MTDFLWKGFQKGSTLSVTDYTLHSVPSEGRDHGIKMF